MTCQGCGLTIEGPRGIDIHGREKPYHACQADCVGLLRVENSKLRLDFELWRKQASVDHAEADKLRAEAALYKKVSDEDDETIERLEKERDAALLQLRAMVEERDLYSDVVDAAESWLKHHGHGGVSEAEANKALRYQVEQLGEKVAQKPRCEPGCRVHHYLEDVERPICTCGLGDASMTHHVSCRAGKPMQEIPFREATSGPVEKPVGETMRRMPPIIVSQKVFDQIQDAEKPKDAVMRPADGSAPVSPHNTGSAAAEVIDKRLDPAPIYVFPDLCPGCGSRFHPGDCKTR